MSVVAVFFSLGPRPSASTRLIYLRMVESSVFLQTVFVEVRFVAKTTWEMPVVVVDVRLVPRQLALAIAARSTMFTDVFFLFSVVLLDVIFEEQLPKESLRANFALVVQLLSVFHGDVTLKEVQGVGLTTVRTVDFNVDGAEVRLHLAERWICVVALGTLFRIVRIDLDFCVFGKMLSSA